MPGIVNARMEQCTIDDDAPRRALQAKATAELQRILDFWLRHAPDEERGGFHGAIANDLTIDRDAPKGLVLCARILWTFSRAYLHEPRAAYREMADRALSYLQAHFRDAEFGGYYLSVDTAGRPLRTKKQVYGQAFVLFGLSEYVLATGCQEVLELVREQFHTIESIRDTVHGGYLEAFTREWAVETDMRLGENDLNEQKSMNTHLHLLEAYTNALRVLRTPDVEHSLAAMIDIVVGRIVDPRTAHFRLYFDEGWTVKSDLVSYGHDIEGSWLLVEAAELLGDPGRLAQARTLALRMVAAVARDGMAPDGSLLNEGDSTGIVDDDRHWWPQAEAVVGLINAYQLSGNRDYLLAAAKTWAYIERYLLDYRHGEWFWKVDRHGVPDDRKFKVDEWKCPYHNSRACFEIIERLSVDRAPE